MVKEDMNRGQDNPDKEKMLEVELLDTFMLIWIAKTDCVCESPSPLAVVVLGTRRSLQLTVIAALSTQLTYSSTDFTCNGIF